jgi:uncharacterized protein (TIGR02145 family)
MMGLDDNNGDTHTQNFLYLPVTNPTTGKTWLNNNLGANYANANHASFNINQQATSSTDFNAYGSLFQWGRQADGHELITWTSGTAGDGTTASVSGTSAISVPAVGHFLHGNADWLNPKDDTLWASESSTNNVCPLGYRLPQNPNGTLDATNEFWVESQTWAIQTSVGAASSTLALPMSGNRNYGTGTVKFEGTIGYYWSGSVNSTFARLLLFNTSAVAPNSYYKRAYGFSVRCLKN